MTEPAPTPPPPPPPPPRRPMSRDAQLRIILLVFGGLYTGAGVWQALDPGSFFSVIAAFGRRNDHFLRDLSTFVFATGIVLFLAAFRRSWRVPVLFLATLQTGLHAVNHLFDIGEARPAALGPINFVILAVSAVVLLYAFVLAIRAPEPR